MTKNNDLYSIKMRASQQVDGANKHISGAEKILTEQQVYGCVNSLIERGLHHDKGEADFLNIKIEKVAQDELQYLDALTVTTVEVDDYQQGLAQIDAFLAEIGAPGLDALKPFLEQSYAMRGAMLLDVKTLTRLEPDPDRGIRATYMDQDRSGTQNVTNFKNHYEEAIVLATKVVNCPGIIGEICISDDPNYVTGYVASREVGYRRITKLKPLGSENGGRIFLFDSDQASVDEAINYLQRTRVIVRGVRALNAIATSANTLVREKPLELLARSTDTLRSNHLFRTMKSIESAQGSHITLDGKEYVLMASNSYLDLTAHPYMIQRTHEALDKYGVGSGGSRLTTGNTVIHDALETKIAEFKGVEASIVFNTGYVANLATISALMRCGNSGIVFSDELNHASIIDGCRLSKCKTVVYKHNDMEDLERKIKENPCDFGLVVSDAVFSMDGDILNLPEFVRICRENNLMSMVDEAHATGVIGKTGRGIVEHFNMPSDMKPDVLMGTLSKAVGGEGGYVAGSNILIDYLRNTARGFIFSTSLSPAIMASDLAGLELIEKEPQRVAALQENVEFFCQCLNDAGLDVHSQTAIVPVIIGDEARAMEVSAQLMEAGFYISAIRYPTVARGQARLRVALMATHTHEELARAATLIAECLS